MNWGNLALVASIGILVMLVCNRAEAHKVTPCPVERFAPHKVKVMDNNHHYCLVQYDTKHGYAVNLAEISGCAYHSQYKYLPKATNDDSGFKYRVFYKCDKTC